MAVGLFSGLAMAQGTHTEASDVARAVLAQTEWVREATLCPAGLMAAKEARDHLARNECQPGRLASCLGKCTQGSPGACYWLAYALQQKVATPDASETLYQRSCKLGVMSGCTNRAAGMFQAAPDDERVKACAARTFEAACAFDDPWACTMNAFHLSRGIGTRQDTARALKSLEKSCKYGPADEACTYGERIRREIQSKKQRKE